jgi:hypothetical protein
VQFQLTIEADVPTKTQLLLSMNFPNICVGVAHTTELLPVAVRVSPAFPRDPAQSITPPPKQMFLLQSPLIQ